MYVISIIKFYIESFLSPTRFHPEDQYFKTTALMKLCTNFLSIRLVFALGVKWETNLFIVVVFCENSIHIKITTFLWFIK